MLEILMKMYRVRKINIIFQTFPTIEENQRKWLLKDLLRRLRKQSESVIGVPTFSCSNLKDRITLLQSAHDIIEEKSYIDDQQASAKVQEVYQPWLVKALKTIGDKRK